MRDYRGFVNCVDLADLPQAEDKRASLPPCLRLRMRFVPNVAANGDPHRG